MVRGDRLAKYTPISRRARLRRQNAIRSSSIAALPAGAGQEQLHQVRRRGARAAAADLRVVRDVAPAEDDQVLGLGQLGDRRLGDVLPGQRGRVPLVIRLLAAIGRRGREEDQPGDVRAGRRQVEVTDLAEEGVRDLGQDARAVPGSRVAALGAAVLQVAEGGERFGHHIVPGPAGQISDKADAAGVVLEAAVIQPRGRCAAGRRHQNSCRRRLVCVLLLRSGRRWPCREGRRGGSLATRKLRPHYITGRIRPKI